MRYDSGMLTNHARWVRLDGRNWRAKHWSHRLTVRDRLTIARISMYLKNNFEGVNIFYNSSNPPNIWVSAQTFARTSYYMNEDVLVQLIMGFDPHARP